MSVALVAGARLRPDGTASRAIRRRVAASVCLWKRGTVSHLMMSGGVVESHIPEADVMAHLARSEGVPCDAILLEATSRNSRENIAMSLAKLSDRHIKRFVLVSDVWHLPRLYMLTHIIGRNTDISVTLAPAASGEPLLRQWRFIVREVGALVIDSMRAWFVQPIQSRTPNAEEGQ